MAGLTVLKKCGKIQNVVSSSDFEIFSPEMHPLTTVKFNFVVLSKWNFRTKIGLLTHFGHARIFADFPHYRKGLFRMSVEKSPIFFVPTSK